MKSWFCLDLSYKTVKKNFSYRIQAFLLGPDGTTYYIPKDMCPDFDTATQAASQSQVNPQDFLLSRI